MLEHQTFPTAKKVTCYMIDSGSYELIGQREAVENPNTIRAMLDDKLRWFVPAKVVAIVPRVDSPAIAGSTEKKAV